MDGDPFHADLHLSRIPHFRADAMSEKQTFRSEVLPVGIPNGKFQIPKSSKIWNLQSGM